MLATTFTILYEDDYLVAINKPSGWLVHRTGISEDKQFVLQTLRNQLGQRLYPLHRLDRGTSGVLLLAKDQATASLLGAQFRTQAVRKKYLAVVRGFLNEEGIIDHPVGDEHNKNPKEALTRYKKLAQTELAVAVGRYATARYSLAEVEPETGRWRQIRKHFSHLRHPIVGDKKHGDIKHNAFFKDRWGLNHLLLHAAELHFDHPVLACRMVIQAPLADDFDAILKALGLR